MQPVMDTVTSELFKCSDNKTCAVCGDIALGYNFNAVTCESCKAFFRRNALKDKELRCPFKESCQINSITRRFCQRCRLAKCYAVGMKRELIMTEADKEKKRRKIEANKAKQGCYNSPSKKVNSTGTTVSEGIQASVDTVERGIQTEPLAKNCGCSCIMSCFLKPNVYVCSPTPAVSPPIGSDPNSPISSWQSDKADGCIPLSSVHRTLLEDLIIANKALDAPVDQEISNLLGEEFKSCGSKSLLDVINLTALAIRRLIKMCKRINAFRTLCQEDQLSLLKQGCTQMMILRSVATFDPDRNSWKIPHTVDQMSRIKVEVLKEARGNLYEAHEAFLRSFDARASSDTAIICLLIAVALFDPTRNHLEDKVIIAQHQGTYYELLQRYLESIYCYRDAKEIYDHLIWKMSELRQLNEEYVRVYLDVNPSQVEPLLIEIFDLKPH
uniref:Putative hormone-like 96 protein n=1 Tax=Panstrongylus megistus TaxID=65343 RepID=A0A069DU14_9HEMI